MSPQDPRHNEAFETRLRDELRLGAAPDLASDVLDSLERGGAFTSRSTRRLVVVGRMALFGVALAAIGVVFAAKRVWPETFGAPPSAMSQAIGSTRSGAALQAAQVEQALAGARTLPAALRERGERGLLALGETDIESVWTGRLSCGESGPGTEQAGARRVRCGLASSEIEDDRR